MSSPIEGIKGIIPAIYTPFTDGGKPDLKILGKYFEYLIGAGCDGFFVSGSNGECFLQSKDERLLFTEAVVKELAGRLTQEERRTAARIMAKWFVRLKTENKKDRVKAPS